MEHLLHESVILILCALAAIAITVRLKLPTILGFLIAGVLLGTFSSQLSLNSEGVAFLSELGVAFMLFLVGVELSLEKIIELRRTVFITGGLQVLICGALAFLLFYYVLNMSALVSFIAASVLTMSSTALVLKLLSENGELMHQHGRNAISILLFQDIAAVAIIVIVSSLAAFNVADGIESDVYLDIASATSYALFRAVLLFAAFYLIGKYVLTRSVKYVIGTSSEEFRLLFILAIIFGSSYLAELSGASMPIGAFLAGIIISETQFGHEFEHDIKPFRNVLLGLFFITLGMKFDVQTLIHSWDVVLLSLLFLIIIKAAAIFIILRRLDKPQEESMSTALVLAQGGEFGLLITSLALKNNLFSTEVGYPFIVAIVISMGIAPILVTHHQKISERLEAICR